MNKLEVTIDQANERIANENSIVVDVNLEYNEFFDRVDTAYECAVRLTDETVLLPCEKCFVDSFCDRFADAVQSTDIDGLNDLVNDAANIGFWVAYPAFIGQ